MDQENASASDVDAKGPASIVALPSPLSLRRLREAFEVMLGPKGDQQPGATSEERAQKQVNEPEQISSPFGAAEISPRSVVEAMLFVGQPDNQPLSAREMAAAMRGVSPAEIDSAVAELNTVYGEDGAPYMIERTNAGYRMVLRDEFERMRDKFYGRVREARLSQTALEVLSIVAYNQPATLALINEIRGTPSGAVLATLVRRKLLRLDRPTSTGEAASYTTTERFLQLFGLENLAALPRSEELEKL